MCLCNLFDPAEYVSLSFNKRTHRRFPASLTSFLLYEIIPNLWGSVCVFIFVSLCVFPYKKHMWNNIWNVPNLSCELLKNTYMDLLHQMSKNYMWLYVHFIAMVLCDRCMCAFVTTCLIRSYPIVVLTNICNIRAQQISLSICASLRSHVSSPGSALWNENTSSVQILTINKSSVRDKCHISPCLSRRV